VMVKGKSRSSSSGVHIVRSVEMTDVTRFGCPRYAILKHRHHRTPEGCGWDANAARLDGEGIVYGPFSGAQHKPGAPGQVPGSCTTRRGGSCRRLEIGS
jgi:hypothetical protein